MARAGMHRGDVVVAVGGGVVTDVAGYAASSYHRGTAVVHVPTTLLGQVDAAIGGKTGVNLPEGKNLVGSFWQPLGVLLRHRDPREPARTRMAVRPRGDGQVRLLGGGGPRHAWSLVRAGGRAAWRCKAEVVAGDEREGGRRVILNYGHTLAHALEAAGLASEDAKQPRNRASPRRGGGDRPRVRGRARPPAWAGSARLVSSVIVEVVAGYDLPVSFRRARTLPRLVAFMARDKKSAGGLTLMLDGPGGVEPVQRRQRRARARGARRTRRRPMSPERPKRAAPARSCCSSPARTSACSASASPRSTAPRRSPTTSSGPARRPPRRAAS